jgi:hypothetical protein
MVYFSKDSIWDVNDPFVGELPSYIKLEPDEQKTFSLTTELTGTSVGDYYVIVRTDNKNNIYEVNDLNNTLSTSSTVNVEVALLPLFVLNKKQMVNNKGLYYRIEVPDSLIDQSLLISLKGDSINGANDLFIKFGDVPDRSNFDLTSVKPFNGNQELIISGLKKGTYYLLVYGATESGNQQDISLYAGTINFQVRSLETNEGGNAGTVTVEMDGAKFTSDMKVALQNANNTIVADTLIFVDATKVFVTFNLMDAPLGFCDVVASKLNGDVAILKNGFKIVTKSPFGLVTSVKYPIQMQYWKIGSVAIQFANDGNIDIPLPKFTLYSLDYLPIAFLSKDLNKGQTELKLEFRELNGPQYVLRPGAINTIYIYVLSNRGGLRRFKFE